MADQNSIISYAPQPYFSEGLCTIVGYENVSSIDNEDGIFTIDLSDYTTINADQDASEFAVQIDFDKQSEHLTNSNMSIGLIGCSLLTYEDSGGSPDLDTEISENIACYLSSDITAVSDELASFAHNSQDSVNTFCKQPLPGIISGGRSNLLFAGFGVSGTGSSATVYAMFARSAADVLARPHAKLIIGHLFIGVDISVTINPNSFVWSCNPENEQFIARDWGAINSDGTLVKRSTAEFIKIENYTLYGSEITAIASEIESSLVPNFFDLVKANTSYPLLFSPYPTQLIVAAALTIDQANLTARQNFFSIYGFMMDTLKIGTREYRNELDTDYKAQFKIQETR